MLGSRVGIPLKGYCCNLGIPESPDMKLYVLELAAIITAIIIMEQVWESMSHKAMHTRASFQAEKITELNFSGLKGAICNERVI